MANPSLPFHFRWRSGNETQSLADVLIILQNQADDAAWHLQEGHLQYALSTQGYGVLAEGISGPNDQAVLRERLKAAIEMYAQFQKEKPQGAGNIAAAFSSLAGQIKKKASEVLAAGKTKAGAAIAAGATKAAEVCGKVAEKVQPAAKKDDCCCCGTEAPKKTVPAKKAGKK